MKIHRLLVAMLGISLVVFTTTDIVRAQTPVPKPSTSPPLQFAGSTHHVKGTAQKGDCPSTLAGMVLKVSEWWYGATGSNARDLALPALAGTLDKLTFNGSQLVQGRVLGSVTLTGVGEFDVTWSEVATAARKPWAVSVQNVRTGATVTVYRLLRLEISGGTNLGAVIKTPPVIQFFGAETTKDVGPVTVDCFPMG